jgi:hypothetical protein
MTNNEVDAAVAAVKTDVSTAVSDVKSEVAKVEAKVVSNVASVKTTWLTKIKPYLTHALAGLAGAGVTNPSGVLSILAEIKKFL